MAQIIELNPHQIRILREIGKAYGHAITFTDFHLSPTGGALVNWHDSAEAWEKLNDAMNMNLNAVEVSREELSVYLDWFDKQEKDEIEFKSLTGMYRKRTHLEQALFVYLRLAQAFNYPQDIKKDDE